ncbi:hypothetical protein PLEOSDRAFT_154319 [Pleurotus ostreatus PC15]|uniref:Uncharacterized protein n=1 Tax=Pleurotus ostreatus (strain PC15) TaxID=1137138 RepID=A0A067NW14_PLEO1|nr:hypothetical protein PLEOSDRAFT_154319 [Pleurotus ostreatus PC15]
MQPALPPEILCAILECTHTTEALLNFSRASRQFCQLAELYLYANAAFHPTVANLQCFLDAIEMPHRGLLARNLIFFTNDHPLQPTELHLIDKILMKIVNLQSLRLVWPSMSFRPSLQFTQGIPSGLRHITISSPDLDHTLVCFLEAQPQLESLWLDCPSLHRKSPFSASPWAKLKYLTIDYSALPHFFHLPASVTHLAVLDIPEHTHPRPPKQTSFLENIRVLSCHSSFNSRVLMELVASLPNLEWIEIRESRPYLCIVEQGLFSALQPAPKLRGIRFAHQVVPPHHGLLWEVYFNIVESLQFVEFYEDLGGFQRWYRHSVEPVPVRWRCLGGNEWLSDWVEDVDQIVREELLLDGLF